MFSVDFTTTLTEMPSAVIIRLTGNENGKITLTYMSVMACIPKPGKVSLRTTCKSFKCRLTT